MKLLAKLAIVSMLTIILTACATVPGPRNASEDLTRLADYMTGFFSSLEQSQNDPTFYDIHLHMARIWPNQKNGYWLYVEQAVAGKDPYRQRVYHVSEPMPGRFTSKVYELEGPEAFIGAWNDKTPFDLITPENLVDRPGCTIYLVKETDGTFRGATNQKDCLSALRGSTYATSQVRMKPDLLISWDRGYDDNDKQVWGAIKSGYHFDKLENFELN